MCIQCALKVIQKLINFYLVIPFLHFSDLESNHFGDLAKKDIQLNKMWQWWNFIFIMSGQIFFTVKAERNLPGARYVIIVENEYKLRIVISHIKKVCLRYVL